MLGEPDIDKNIELIDMNPSAEKTNYWGSQWNRNKKFLEEGSWKV